MAFSSTTPLRGDTERIIWAKMLIKIQALPGSLPHNDFQNCDTLPIIKKKLLRALQAV